MHEAKYRKLAIEEKEEFLNALWGSLKALMASSSPMCMGALLR
ncbi:MAG: hypothetical protein QW486_04740 [Candidatus Bathyarchaeia archaeon]